MSYQDTTDTFEESLLGVFQPFQDESELSFNFLEEEKKIMGEISSPRSPLFPKAPLSSPGISEPTTMHQIASFFTKDSVKVELRRRVTIGPVKEEKQQEKDIQMIKEVEVKKPQATKASKKGRKKSSTSPSNSKSTTQDRKWNLISQSKDYQDLHFEITQATRLEPESAYLWNTLFCTLKYRFYVAARHVTGKGIPYLITRPSIVRADETDKPVVKDYKNGPALHIDGVEEVPLVRSNTCHEKHVATVSAKMGYLSYRKHEHEYCMQFSIYAGNDTTAEPIAVLRSDPVKIYARKPNKPRKRKRGQADGPRVEPPCKRPKKSTLNEFEKKLDELIALHKNMSDADCSDERQKETRRLFGRVHMMLSQ